MYDCQYLKGEINFFPSFATLYQPMSAGSKFVFQPGNRQKTAQGVSVFCCLLLGQDYAGQPSMQPEVDVPQSRPMGDTVSGRSWSKTSHLPWILVLSMFHELGWGHCADESTQPWRRWIRAMVWRTWVLGWPWTLSQPTSLNCECGREKRVWSELLPFVICYE